MLRAALSSPLAVANPHYRSLIEFAGTFTDQHRHLPKQGDYEFWLGTLNEPLKSGVGAAIGEVLSIPPEDWTPEYISKGVTEALKSIAAKNAVARLGTMVPDVKPEALAELTEQIRKIEPVTISGLKSLEEPSKWIYTGTQESEKVITSGFSLLDQQLQGGFRPELVYLLADAGIGKSTALMNIGAAAALKGARVFEITFELHSDPLLRRYARRITESTGPEIRHKPDVVMTKMGQWLRFAKGSVHVLYQPPFTVGAEELKALVDQFVQIHGGVDLIILDYLDLMRPPKGAQNPYEALGQLSHMVRNLGVQNEATTLSATQAGRQAHNARHIRLDMMGDSYNKVRAADIIIGFAQTAEEFEAYQARLALLKVRENPGRGMEIPIYVNLDLMLMADLDNANTRRIMKQFNHPVNQVFQYERREEAT